MTYTRKPSPDPRREDDTTAPPSKIAHTLVIGIDPAFSGPEGIAALWDGQLVIAEKHKPPLPVRDTERRICLAMVSYPATQIHVVVESWSILAKGEGTTMDTVLKLEQAAQKWMVLAELHGIRTRRVNVSTWRAPFRIRGESAVCKKMAKKLATQLYGGLYSSDVAEAILIATWQWNRIKVGIA